MLQAFGDFFGAALTLVTLLFLFLSGYLAARAALRGEADRDPLALAIATLVATSGIGVLAGLVLGALGLLRDELGLVVLVLLTLPPLLRARRNGEDLWLPLRRLGRRFAARVRENPILSLIAGHAVLAEAVRGLMRPPLSWDAIMYHLLITGTWLVEERIAPIFGMHPTYFYGYQPSNGSVWLWWWMAPSHSELYANLAFFPHTALLALAAGGVARELGARRLWPLASFLMLLTPVVIRFTATQYVDIFVGGTFAAAAFFTLRWLRALRPLGEPRWGDALLAGAGLGLAAGAKVLGLLYVLPLAGMAVLLARGEWRRRVPQLGGAILALVLLGGFFYLRNVAVGAGPLGARCEGTPGAASGPTLPRIPRVNTVADLFDEMISDGTLVDVFLGVPRTGAQEIAVGPQVLLLLPVFLLPWLLPSPGERDSRRGALLVWSQVLIQVFIWVTVPYGSNGHVFANVRYLDGLFALMFAGAVAMAERYLPDAAVRWLALLILIQDLLMLHTEMPRTVRLMLAAVDVLLVVAALSPRFRSFGRRRWRELAVAGLALALLAAPLHARFRQRDRARAFRTEYTAHKTSAFLWARAWGWLDRNGEDGPVAVVGAPSNFFIYPVMGMRLERPALYINVNRQDFQNAADYPACDPRVNPDPQAWLENLVKHRVRWVYLHRYPQIDFPMEQGWIVRRPDLFVPRYADNVNVLYEFLPGSPGWQPPPPR